MREAEETVGMVLTLSAYAVLVIFLGISLTRFFTLWRAAETTARFSSSSAPLKPLLLLKTAGDILFLTRLLRTNDLLWIGEWLFHCSFVLVVLQHLRFLLDPVPEWVRCIQPFGLIAGYLLPFSLLHIFIMKIREEKGHFPPYNIFLVILLFVLAVTGLLMRTVFRTDTVAVKQFVVGIFTFSPMNVPDGILFILHFVPALLLAAFLPSHIFAAPFVITEARKREEALRLIIHDEEPPGSRPQGGV
jgi:nitrate reductase gamma subunit